MHAVDWRACGLEGYGKPTGYLERQLRRFNGLWEHNKTRELPRVQEVGDWLAANMPESPAATIVHGDYRLGNTMVADDAPARLIAIFDWELATIGDPLADLGYLTVTWVQPGDPEDTMFSSLSAVTRREGFPTRDELIAHYEERTGRSMSDLRWYQALALWKAAVFMEGNYKRSLAGTTDDPYLKLFDEGVPRLAEAAHEISQLRRRDPDRTVRRERPAGRLRRRADHQRVGLASAPSATPRASTGKVRRLFRDDPEALALLRRLEVGELTEESSPSSSARCSAYRRSATRPGRPAVRRHAAGAGR